MTFPHHGEGSDVQGQDSNQSGTDNSNQAVQDALENANGPAEPEGQQTLEPEAQAPSSPWADYVKDLPESVVPLVEPIFKKWDADVTQRFQSLHSEYDPYKPLVDGYEPDYLSQAAQLYEALETDPQRFMQALYQAYGVNPEQGTAGQHGASAQQQQQQYNPQQQQFDPSQQQYQPDEQDLANNPLYAQLQQTQELVRVLAEREVSRQEQQTQQQQQQELDTALKQMHETHGDFDENYVLSLIAQGVDPDAAVGQFNQALQQHMQRVNAPNANAPVVVGAGGGYPTQQVDTSQMSAKERQAHVVALLAADANQQG